MNIEMTSAAGVAIAVKSTITRIATRHDLMIAARADDAGEVQQHDEHRHDEGDADRDDELQHEVDVLLRRRAATRILGARSSS